ncbi:RagB/SusD family nutrient uptake outer membrane protein [Flavobacteriaceae bacterium PRS1]|nr:RagB/SusD family nutrient uptake outer membrane protein [Flavobacteriaceae bacterium PRS1]
MKINKFYQKAIGFALISIMASCNLDEEIFTEILSSEFGKSNEEVNAMVGAAYSSYGGWIGGPWVAQEISSDIGIVPTRGTDWAENGQWARLHEHDFQPDDFYAGGAWNTLYTGINNVNRIIYQLEGTGTEAALQTIKELKVLRALNYYYLMDIYGNVPLVTSFADADENPATNSRSEIFSFVVSEVEGVINDLPTTVGGSSYGKINKWTAHALLAKVYLNAEVFNGSAEWAKAIQNADVIIDSGNYNLTSNFFDNFSIDNESSSENIFVLVYDKVFSGGMNLAVRSLHYSSQQTYNFTTQPWNGFSSMEAFYNSFDPTDVRLGSFVEGPQYDSSGAVLLDNQAEPSDPNGPPIDFTPQIRDVRDALRQDGVRIGKFELEMGGNPAAMSNDFPLFRLGDIILTKAEAELRLGNAGTALILVNMIRERAGVTPFTSLTLADLLSERGRETAFEAYRRQDQIRFGTFNDAWEFKPADPSTHINIFPVSRSNMEANPSLTQNPGY